MTKTIIFTGFAAGLLACTASAAMAQTIPGECRIVETRNDGMTVAECPTQGGYRASAIRPAECRSAMMNRDGVLACSGTTAIVGPMRADAQPQGGLGGFLAQVLGAPQAAPEAMDMEWSRGSQPLGQRRADLDARIAAGGRDGSLSRGEADALAREHDTLVRLEAQYAADGRFSTAERTELADRYDALSDRVAGQRRDDRGYDVGDNDGQRWQPMMERSADFERRVTAARAARVITLTESTRLRTDWRGLMQLESNYRQNGLDPREAADLDARMQGLEQRLGRFGQPSQSAGPAGGANSWDQLARRIAAGETNGNLRPNQVQLLRTEHGDLVRLDAAWRRIGMGASDRAYLARRQTELGARIDQMQSRR